MNLLNLLIYYQHIVNKFIFELIELTLKNLRYIYLQAIY